MGECIQEGGFFSCECSSCGATVGIAFYLRQGELAYCESCGEAYIIISRYPLKLQRTVDRTLDTPWLDGSFFI